MSNRIFNPPSWDKSGQAVQEAGGDVVSQLKSALAGVQVTGEGGLTLLDEVVAGITPAVMEAVNGALDGMAEGLKAEGAAIVEVGKAYAEVEEAAAEIGDFMEGEY